MRSEGAHTRIVTADRVSALGLQWFTALSGLSIRHPNGRSRVLLEVSADDVLKIALDSTLDTRDLQTPMRSPFVIACVRLRCWPGEVAAREWFAAGFAGYCMHEALELVTCGGAPVLDPHREPYATNPANASLRHGFPPVLTNETLARAMKVVF